MRCPKCGSYGFDCEDRCSNCGYFIPSQKPPAWWGRKDFQSPEKTPEYGERGGEEHHPNGADWSEVSKPELHDCPHCRERSLFWNQHTLMYECLNARCRRRVTASEYKTKKEEPTKAQQGDEKQAIEVPPLRQERENKYWDTPHDVNEEQDNKTEGTDRKRVQICPACRQTSLYWSKFTGLYECFNPSCKRDFSRSELEKLTVQPKPHEEHIPPKDRPSERLENCPVCGQGMLRWNPAISKYECLYWKCRRTITKEYFESVKSPKPKGRLQLPRFNKIPRVSIGLLILVVFAFTLLYGLTDFGQSGRSAILVTSPTPTPGTFGTVSPVITPTPSPTPTPTPKTTPAPNPSECIGDVCTYYGEQPPYARTGFGYDRIQLVDNPNATDPTWLQLKAFITADKTDEKLYMENFYMCGAFAEDVHDNAEAAGIKAAWISIDFQDGSAGHALNAFKTTDKGLVYIDCTSSRDALSVRVCRIDPSTGRCTFTNNEPSNYDRVAYVNIGRAYGLISLNAVRGFSYFDYETYRQQKNAYDAALAQYNSDVAAYNADGDAYDSLFNRCGGYATAGECQRLIQWYDDLERQRVQLNSRLAQLEGQEATLGDFWKPLGVVSRIEIYW